MISELPQRSILGHQLNELDLEDITEMAIPPTNFFFSLNTP